MTKRTNKLGHASKNFTCQSTRFLRFFEFEAKVLFLRGQFPPKFYGNKGVGKKNLSGPRKWDNHQRVSANICIFFFFFFLENRK